MSDLDARTAEVLKGVRAFLDSVRPKLMAEDSDPLTQAELDEMCRYLDLRIVEPILDETEADSLSELFRHYAKFCPGSDRALLEAAYLAGGQDLADRVSEMACCARLPHWRDAATARPVRQLYDPSGWE